MTLCGIIESSHRLSPSMMMIDIKKKKKKCFFIYSLQPDLLRSTGIDVPIESRPSQNVGNDSNPTVELLVQFHRSRRSPWRQSSGKYIKKSFYNILFGSMIAPHVVA